MNILPMANVKPKDSRQQCYSVNFLKTDGPVLAVNPKHGFALEVMEHYLWIKLERKSFGENYTVINKTHKYCKMTGDKRANLITSPGNII